MKKEIIINLKQSVKTPRDGEMVDCSAITIYSPTGKQIKYIARLENAYNQALMSVMGLSFFKDLQNQQPSDAEKQEITAEGIIEILNKVSDSEVYEKCFDTLKLLLTSEPATAKADFDGFKATAAIFDELSIPDLKNILGEYIVNFITPSQKQEKSKE